MILRLLVVLFSSLMMLPASLLAGNMTVAPTTLTLSPSQPNATFNLTNRSGQEGFYQVQLFTWDQDDGETVLRQQQDLVVTPPVALIPANGEQLIRIIRQQPSTEGPEKSYRLIISEVPDTESPDGASLKVLLRLSVPVFVGTQDQTHSLHVSTQGTSLLFTNGGNHHAKLVDVSIEQGENQKMLLKSGMAGYVLPGKTFPMELPDGIDTTSIRRIHLTVNGQPAIVDIEGAGE